jgi:sulfatase maturation enzyme AslB (radical SAM superfamily)
LTLVGTEKFCFDIRDYFTELSFELADKLGDESDALYVICDFDATKYATHNLTYPKNYIYGTDMINLLSESETFRLAVNHKNKNAVVLLGNKTLTRLLIGSNPHLRVSRTVDINNSSIVACENSEMLIAITSDVLTVKKYLQKSNLQFGSDFYFYDSLNSGLAELLTKVIKSETREPFTCNIAAMVAGLDHLGGVNACCARFEFGAGSVSYNSLEQIFESPVMRILHLTTINRTYLFCTEYCKFQMRDIAKELDVTFRNFYPLPHISEYTITLSYMNSCNLWCRSCRNTRRGDEADRSESTLAIHDELLRSLDKINNIMHGSGEILFGKLFRKLLFEQNPKDFIRFTTNGMLLNAKNLEKLRQKYKTIRITISMDGGTQETFEYLRRGANFKIFLRNLKTAGEFREQGKLAELNVACVVQKDNFRELEEIVHIARGAKIDKVLFSPIQQWYLSSNEIFLQLDVYNPTNPLHNEFLEIVAKPIFRDKDVFFAGINQLLAECQ